MRIELTLSAWKAEVLPLNHTRKRRRGYCTVNTRSGKTAPPNCTNVHRDRIRSAEPRSAEPETFSSRCKRCRTAASSPPCPHGRRPRCAIFPAHRGAPSIRPGFRPRTVLHIIVVVAAFYGIARAHSSRPTRGSPTEGSRGCSILWYRPCTPCRYHLRCIPRCSLRHVTHTSSGSFGIL